MPEKVTQNLPEDRDLDKLIVLAQSQSVQQRQEMGRVGEFLGSRDNAVIYIALAVILLSVISSVVLACFEPNPLRSDLIKALASLAVSTVGFMFGSLRRSGDR